jgi:hypothetical protein
MLIARFPAAIRFEAEIMFNGEADNIYDDETTT